MKNYLKFKLSIIIFIVFLISSGCNEKNRTINVHIVDFYPQLKKYKDFQEFKTNRVGINIDSIFFLSSYRLNEKSVLDFINTIPTLHTKNLSSSKLESCLDFKQISYAIFQNEMEIMNVEKHVNIHKYIDQKRYKIYSFNSQKYFNYIVIDQESEIIFHTFKLITF